MSLGEARIRGQVFGLLGAVGQQGPEGFGGDGVEGEISEAFVAGFQFRDAGREKMVEAQLAAVEVNCGGGAAGGACAPGGLEEKPNFR